MLLGILLGLDELVPRLVVKPGKFDEHLLKDIQRGVSKSEGLVLVVGHLALLELIGCDLSNVGSDAYRYSEEEDVVPRGTHQVNQETLKRGSWLKGFMVHGCSPWFRYELGCVFFLEFNEITADLKIVQELALISIGEITLVDESVHANFLGIEFMDVRHHGISSR